jgi:uncharacterized RDD family membrane protein YckC
MWFSRWFNPNLLSRPVRRTYDFLAVGLLVVGLVVSFTASAYWGSSLLGLSVVTAFVEMVHARAIGRMLTS